MQNAIWLSNSISTHFIALLISLKATSSQLHSSLSTAVFFFLVFIFSIARSENITNSYNVTHSSQSNGTVCVPKWHPCSLRKNESGASVCCSGWHCVRPYYADTGRRCEPPRRWQRMVEYAILVVQKFINVPPLADSTMFSCLDGSPSAIRRIDS